MVFGLIKVTEVKVLVEGKHNVKGDRVTLSSTVTLIKSDKNIIVDTSSLKHKKSLLEALKKESLTSKDIDAVILTHLHLDHTINVALFENAKVYCKFCPKYPGQCHSLSKGYLDRFELVDGTEMAKGVSILLTPGHTWDSLSVLVQTSKGKIVISGDALASEEWVDLNKPPLECVIYDAKKFNESRRKILKIADYIIPGHGKMFKV